MAGFCEQDDQGCPRREDWLGKDDEVDVPPDVKDARAHLERKLRSSDCEWYLWTLEQQSPA